jgi:F-type H+-transporting ATPase subunit b
VAIDWFTVLASIFNFLLLVFLLRRFLYRPIVEAMENRERKIAERLTSAESSQREAEAEISTWQQKNSALEQEREELLQTAREEVQTQQQLWLEAARTEVDATRTRWHHALREEQTTFLETVRREIGTQSHTLLQRALADLADVDLEQLIVARFLEKLDTLSSDSLTAIDHALQTGGGSLVLNSAFPLDETERQAVQRALATRLGSTRPLRFETRPDLIAGLELVAPGHKVSWSLSSYLHDLEEALRDILTRQERQRDG